MSDTNKLREALGQCDEDVFKNGVSLGFFDMTKEQAEQYCKSETLRTGRKHDWHYVAGRVHIKAMSEELDASKPEPQAQVKPYITQEHFDRAFPSKPQAHVQAAEPEVFYGSKDGNWILAADKPYRPDAEEFCMEFITLQSHREAIAAEIERIIKENAPVIKAVNEAIAKKDAALDACECATGEALGCLAAAETEGLWEALDQSSDARLKDLVERRLLYAFPPLRAAITKAQEARKS